MSNPKNYDHSRLDQNKDEWGKTFCPHPGHNPPNMMIIPIEGYTHTCPGCGKEIHMHANRPIM